MERIQAVTKSKYGHNRFCGPAALSIVCGVDTATAAKTLRQATGRKSIMGTHDYEMRKAFALLGWKMLTCAVAEKKYTLAKWAEVTRSTRANDIFLIAAGNHWQVVQGHVYCCSVAEDLIDLADAPHRRARITDVYCLIKTQDVVVEPMPPRDNREIQRRAKDRARARAMGITIDRDHNLGRWEVYFTGEEDDPFYDNIGCYSWGEVTQRLDEYADLLCS